MQTLNSEWLPNEGVVRYYWSGTLDEVFYILSKTVIGVNDAKIACVASLIMRCRFVLGMQA